MQTDLPNEYLELTPRDMLRLYDGPGALPCPPELTRWLQLSRKIRDVVELERENDRVEAQLTLSRLERLRHR
jgi:hypothetical protein